MAKIFPINKVLYAVNKNWKKSGTKEGAKVIPIKIKGYEHTNGKVVPIVQTLIKGVFITSHNHTLYENLAEAVEAIS